MTTSNGLSLQLQPRVVPAPEVVTEPIVGLDQAVLGVPSLEQLNIATETLPSVDAITRPPAQGFYHSAGLDLSEVVSNFPRESANPGTDFSQVQSVFPTANPSTSNDVVVNTQQAAVEITPAEVITPVIPRVRFTLPQQQAERTRDLSTNPEASANPEAAQEAPLGSLLAGPGFQRRNEVRPSPESLLDPEIAKEEATIRAGVLAIIALPFDESVGRMESLTAQMEKESRAAA